MVRESGKLPIVDVLRGVAIVIVLAGHSKAGLAFPQSDWAQYFWSQFAVNVGYGVTIFFVVSGFLITRLIDRGPGGLLQPDFKWFYARRVGRIIPLWTFVLLFGAVMVYGVDGSSNRYQYCFKKPCFVFDMPFWLSFPTLFFNWFVIIRSHVCTFSLHWGVMWSLAIEEQFYLLYPWIIRWAKNVHRLVFLLLGVVLVGPLYRLAIYCTGVHDFSLTMIGSFSGFEPIALGCLLYLTLKYARDFLPCNVWGNGGIALSGLVMLLATFYGVDTNAEREPQIYGSTLIAVGAFLLLLGLLNQGTKDIWLLRPLTWPGRYSYGLYLFHATTLYFLHPYIRPLPTWEAFLIYAVTTTLVAAFSYKYFEMPCNHWIRKRFGEK
jgi:peptidoglycan/LPS O-acetylase OafA/YrhL